MVERSKKSDSASLDELYELLRVDLDALRSYETTLIRFTTPELVSKIHQFIEDHERHVRELRVAIEQCTGLKPDAYTPSPVRSARGEKSNLEKIEDSEEAVYRSYEKALTHPLPENLRVMIQKHRDEERRHLEFIQQALHDAEASIVEWEGRGSQPSPQH